MRSQKNTEHHRLATRPLEQSTLTDRIAQRIRANAGKTSDCALRICAQRPPPISRDYGVLGLALVTRGGR